MADFLRGRQADERENNHTSQQAHTRRSEEATPHTTHTHARDDGVALSDGGRWGALCYGKLGINIRRLGCRGGSHGLGLDSVVIRM